MLRLRVAKYCDSVVNEIDLFTETKIQSIKTQTEEDWWNKRRREQIDEVRRIERACLDHVNTLKVEEKEIESGEWMKRAFVEYCFTANLDGLLYLAKVNRYVEPREKRFLDVHLHPRMIFMDGPINNQQSLDVNILEFEVNLCDYFLTDAPVVDISSGIDQCCHIKSAWISAIPHTEQSSIFFNLEDLIIQVISLCFRIQNTREEKEAVDVIKCFMIRRHRISKITIDLQYYNLVDPSQDMKALAQSIRLNNRVKFNFHKFNSNFQEFGLPGLMEKYKDGKNSLVKVTNWQFISEISFDRVSLEELEKADLSSLYSLAYLNLNISSTGKSSSDWNFLDACRASLKHLHINCYERAIPLLLSSNTFSRITKLKSLELSGSFSVELDSQEELFGDLAHLQVLLIHSTTKQFVVSRKRLSGMVDLQSFKLSGSFSVDTDSQEELFADLTQLIKLELFNCDNTTAFQLSRKTFFYMSNLRELVLKGAFSIETNNQEELFADLIHLKKLDISLNEHALTTKWFIQSRRVEKLRLTFEKSPKVASVQIRFRFPKLASLKITFRCKRIECDLTDMMSCFSHVKKLEIASRCYDIMTKGWFNRLTSVKELILDLQSEGQINSQLFEEFNHLTKLTIYIWPQNTLDRCALHKLVHLESIALVDCRDQDKPFDIEDKSMFDGLNSLRTIECSDNNFRTRAYVYFENLDRFLLVVK